MGDSVRPPSPVVLLEAMRPEHLASSQWSTVAFQRISPSMTNLGAREFTLGSLWSSTGKD